MNVGLAALKTFEKLDINRLGISFDFYSFLDTKNVNPKKRISLDDFTLPKSTVRKPDHAS